MPALQELRNRPMGRWTFSSACPKSCPAGGTNPEQLFAAGYAACFHGALSLVAANRKIKLKDVEIDAGVTFGRDPRTDFS